MLAAPETGPDTTPGHSLHELDQRMRQARTTLAQARRGGAVRAGTYLNPWADDPVFDAENLESALARALDHDELLIEFQPLVDARSGALFGGEALLRWRHPEHGLLPFQRFNHAIANPDLRIALDDWALAQACRSARQWPGDGVRVTVNLSIERLLAPGLAEAVRATLRATGLPPRLLELDLPEQLLEFDNARGLESLQELRAMGVRLAIDGFGTGLFSIQRLRRAAVHALKLDPEIIRGVGKDEDSEATVEAIGAMAAALGLEVHARGVEDAGQQAFLVALGCHLQQGSLFGPPTDPAQFAAALGRRPQ